MGEKICPGGVNWVKKTVRGGRIDKKKNCPGVVKSSGKTVQGE